MRTTTTIHLEASDTIEAAGSLAPGHIRFDSGPFSPGSYLALGSGTLPTDLYARIALADQLIVAVRAIRDAAAAELRERGYGALVAADEPDDDEPDDEDRQIGTLRVVRETGIRRCQACAADDADIGAFDHGLPHDLGTGCDFTERDLCEHGDGRVGNHAFHGKGR